MTKQSVVSAMDDMLIAMTRLSNLWDARRNAEGIELNELDAMELYPFEKDFDEMISDFTVWIDNMQDEIEKKVGDSGHGKYE
jgi:hypothetical protein